MFLVLNLPRKSTTAKSVSVMPRETRKIQESKTHYLRIFFSIATSSDPDNPALQPKTKFSKSKNDTRDFEPFQKCKRCGRKNHQICVLYKKEIWKDFICDFCQDNTSKRRKKNPFTAENLPETELSKFIESKVNGYVTGKLLNHTSFFQLFFS